MTVTMYGSAVYELRVRGELDSSWIEMMDLEDVTIVDSPAQGAITVITGVFQDQAELRGLLTRLYDLNLPLLSVRHLRDRA